MDSIACHTFLTWQMQLPLPVPQHLSCWDLRRRGLHMDRQHSSFAFARLFLPSLPARIEFLQQTLLVSFGWVDLIAQSAQRIFLQTSWVRFCDTGH